MRQVDKLDLVKSSVCSLTSTTTTITVSKIRQKKKVVKNPNSIYLSSFFMQDGKINEIWLNERKPYYKLLAKFCWGAMLIRCWRQ